MSSFLSLKRRLASPRYGLAALALVALTTIVGTAIASAPQAINPAAVIVVDGDTIHMRGAAAGTRLVGFNAPETSSERAGCPAERRLGFIAKARLKQIVAGGNISLETVACACPHGTEGTPACNYGRHCGVLRSNGRDVGEMLIAERLAVPYACGRTGCGPPPSPWCGKR
jgi:endonuclease YncB( thermonuclease family)